MNTVKLYWLNPTICGASTTITGVTEKGVIFKETIFHPMSGGQEGDKGTLVLSEKEINVQDTIIENRQIVHIVPPESLKMLKPGETIKMKIDPEIRMSLMRAHTAQHLVSALIYKHLGIETDNTLIGHDEFTAYLAANQPLSVEQILKIIEEANFWINFKTVDVIHSILQKDQIDSGIRTACRGKIPDEEEIQIIEIENLDTICCSGTHVDELSEIRAISFVKLNKGKEFKCYTGKKAFALFSSINLFAITLSNSLSCPIEEIAFYDSKFHEKAKEYESKITQLEINYLKALFERPSLEIKSQKIVIANLIPDKKNLAIAMKQSNYQGIFIAIFAHDVLVYSTSESLSAKQLINKIIASFEGKGGGNPTLAQAKTQNEIQNLEEWLKKNI